MINQEKFTQLSDLSKIDFTGEEQARFTADLNGIAEFVGKVKEFAGAAYDDTLENSVSFSELREDSEVRTATPEQLLANTASENDCYVIPKVV
jgi:aspartyl/glutamyl-tRNA(Asn/Gln) amidotransferase C subunit